MESAAPLFADGCSFTRKLWRNTSKFSQRFEGKMSADPKTINASWSKSTDGKTWQHDFDIDYYKA